jgi:hypothetical protein
LAVGSDGRAYLRCDVCDLYFLDPAQRATPASERERYDLHRYDPADVGYFEFVRPLIDRIRAGVAPPARGLDYGAGRVPLLADRLRTLGYHMSIYDVFYWPAPAVLQGCYEFVTACEVVEHFYDPGFEFGRLRRLLRPGATLFIMTDPRRDQVEFDRWSYRRDPTHVCFYSERTFRWIEAAFGFKNMELTQRVIRLTAPGG